MIVISSDWLPGDAAVGKVWARCVAVSTADCEAAPSAHDADGCANIGENIICPFGNAKATGTMTMGTQFFCCGSPWAATIPILNVSAWENTMGAAIRKKAHWNDIMVPMAKRTMTTPKGILSGPHSALS